MRMLAGMMRYGADRMLDLLLPPRCLATGEIVDRQGQLSPQVWRELDFITAPLCHCCGTPFPYRIAAPVAQLCPACIARPPGWHRARAVFSYDAHSRQMILAFKHGDRLEGAPAFARWMARAGAEILEDADYIVAVPLHWRRLLRRRYNQSAVLAAHIGRIAGKPVIADMLRRVRPTPPLKGMSRSVRFRQLKGAIAIAPQYENLLPGARIVVIDDVMTSGATAESCARALRGHGAAQVDILTLARVVRPVDTFV
jgi:ComF family protein